MTASKKVTVQDITSLKEKIDFKERKVKNIFMKIEWTARLASKTLFSNNKVIILYSLSYQRNIKKT